MFALSNSWFGARLRRVAEQVEEAASLAFEGISFGRGDPVPSFAGVEEAIHRTGVRVPLVETGCLTADPSRREVLSRLSDPDAAARQRAVEEVLRHVELGRAVACPVFGVPAGSIHRPGLRERVERLGDLRALASAGGTRLEAVREIVADAALGREAALGRLCRSLHALTSREPGALFCLETPSSPDSVLDPAGAAHVFEDLRGRRLGYLHDTASAHLLGRLGVAPAGAWLERLVDRLAVVRLHDLALGETGRPPGCGEVDFRLVAGYVRRDVPRVLVVDPGFERTALLEGLRYLRRQGF
ncbi:MAG TPA: TIM barrel protein [Planctomycetota bacterium]|jgi:sugar phosphate isomerase/epimerase|nr:TIM barrel protein [Planctomycetota bacterium]